VSDPEVHKERARLLYSTGDYSFWSSIFAPASDALVEMAGVGPGDRVLDVAAGNGNTALAAARRGVVVTAVDVTPAQIERGRKRADAERLEVEWLEADAEELPFSDASFDCVLSTFGVTFAPYGERAAPEMFRVVRSGGVVGATRWADEGYFARFDALEAEFVPERRDVLLGRLTEEQAAGRFAPHSTSIEVRREMLPMRFASIEQFWSESLERDPDLLWLRAQLTPAEWERWSVEFRRLVADANSADDGSLRVELPYLLVVARVALSSSLRGSSDRETRRGCRRRGSR
jgi:SAM-dependent methyltransferase